MKPKHFFSFMTAAFMIISTQGCDNDRSPSPSARELFLQDLQGQWTITGGHVKYEEQDITYAFAGMNITIGPSTAYAVLFPVYPIWPEAGTFTLEETNDGLFDLLRNDGTRIVVTSLTTTTITFILYDTPANGRVNGIREYTFLMNRMD